MLHLLSFQSAFRAVTGGITGFAVAVSLAVGAGDPAVERMSVRAARPKLQGIAYATAHVLGESYGLKMIRVNASAVSAKVI
jgi:hypothetical protein